MTCLITGCALYDADHDRGCWGDLHAIGGAYVFNACLLGGETAWDGEVHVLSTSPCITFSGLSSRIFERRGVIIMDQAACTLNEVASARVHWTPPT